MKKKLFKIFLLILLIVAIVIVVRIVNFNNAWKVEVLEDYINIRENHDASSKNLGKVSKGKKYKIIETYLDDNTYVWYKIQLSYNKTGWIASEREQPYVMEINNPDFKTKKGQNIDYCNPKIKIYDAVYEVYDIKSITYNHLEITEDSDYEVTHEVYFEENPKDTEESQYWIKYTVKDAFGNESSKLQKIEFTEKPDSNEVLNWEDYKG